VDEIKDKEPNPDSEFDSRNTSKGKIIDVDPVAATLVFYLPKNFQFLELEI
jgi:hypothetical protein